jgi:hypothetical protein
VISPDGGGINQIWFDFVKNTSHERETGKEGKEDGSAETNRDKNEARFPSVAESNG